MSCFPDIPPEVEVLFEASPEREKARFLGLNTEFASTPEIIEHFSPVEASPTPPSGAPQPLRKSAARRRSSVLRSAVALREAQARQEAENEACRIMSGRLRWWLSMRQRAAVIDAGLYGYFKTLCRCHRYVVPSRVKNREGEWKKTGSPGKVQVQRYDGDHPLGLAWVRKDANALSCFLCAPKIHHVRQQEVKDICEQMYERGWRWAMVALTAPHDVNTNIIEFVDKFLESVRSFFSGRAFQNFKEKWKYGYNIRVVECTDDNPDSDNKSGYHFHSHLIIFFKIERDFTDDEKIELSNDIVDLWVKAVIKNGLCDESRKDDLINYSAKVDIRDVKSVKDASISASEYLSKKAALELSPGIFSKNPQLPNRISHWELMALAFTSRPDLVKRALDVMVALKGRHYMQFGKIKFYLNMKDKKDEEVMKEKRSDDVIYEFEPSEYLDIDDKRMQYDIMRTAIKIIKDGDVRPFEAFNLALEMYEWGYDPYSMFSGEIRKLDRRKPPG